MSEVKLRLAIRDLYRGDGGPLNDLDQGWNDGVDAAAEIFSAEIESLKHDIECAVQRNSDLIAENEKLRVDAERYRWHAIIDAARKESA